MANHLLISLGLLGHAVIHLGFLAGADDDPHYPFRLDRSWILPARTRRVVGCALALTCVVAFAALSLGSWDMVDLDGTWQRLAIVGSMASLALLIAFPHRWLAMGALIDIGLIQLTLVAPEWWAELGR